MKVFLCFTMNVEMPVIKLHYFLLYKLHHYSRLLTPNFDNHDVNLARSSEGVFLYFIMNVEMPVGNKIITLLL